MTNPQNDFDPLGVCEFDDVIAWLAAAAPPPEVMAKARLLLLDSIGCIAAGLRHDEVRRIGTSLAPLFPGEGRLPGSDQRLGPAGAAALAAAAMCWDEANEGLAQAHGRPALALVPALIALAGTCSIERLLRALVLGYEIGARAGEVWRIKPGMHVDGSWHALGAAAGCAHLLEADVAQAVRLVACQVPFSLYRPIAFGMSGRNTYPAHAALLGLLAAAASKAGTEAPRGGLAQARALALSPTAPAARSEAGNWLILRAYTKPFAGVRHAHYAAAAAIALRAKLPAVSDIRVLRLHIYGEALRYAGNRAPTRPISAQFSLSFAVAAALRFGDLAPDAYRALDDRELRRLEALVELVEEPSFTAAGRRAARLVAETSSGAIAEAAVDSVPGDPDNQMTEAEVVAKFIRLAAHLPDAGAIADAVMRGSGEASLRL